MIAVQLALCIVLLISSTINSFSIVKIDNLNENQLLDKISHILDHEDDPSETKNHIHVRGNRKYLEDDSFLHKRVVKIIVPHGKEVKVESGPAVYKPLIRFHNKPNSKEHNAGNENNYNIEGTNKDEIFVENESVQIKKKIKQKGVDLGKLAKKLWKRLKALKYKLKDTKKVSGSKNHTRFSSTGNLDAKEYLRSSELRDRPKVTFRWFPEQSTTKPRLLFPRQSFWNFWTHGNTISHNRCEGRMIKVGDRCFGKRQ